MPASLVTTRRVEFRDTDAAGIMHFSVFFTAMESAEQELLRGLGLGVMFRDERGNIGFPRVSVKCDYQSPLRLNDEYQIEVRLGRIGSKSVTYDFAFTLGDRAIAKGEMTSVCCRFADDGTPNSVVIPESVLKRLRTDPMP
jgi:4-hydroxybenzoyl-CoA thioesterase/acyl-CoA thioester hydrolase